MIIRHADNIKSCVYNRVSKLGRRIETRIVAQIIPVSAHQRFLIDICQIMVFNNRFDIGIRRPKIIFQRCSLGVFLRIPHVAVINHIVPRGNKRNAVFLRFLYRSDGRFGSDRRRRRIRRGRLQRNRRRLCFAARSQKQQSTAQKQKQFSHTRSVI